MMKMCLRNTADRDKNKYKRRIKSPSAKAVRDKEIRKQKLTLATAWVFSTHAMRGTRTAAFPSRETTHASVSGVASIRANTASAPILQATAKLNFSSYKQQQNLISHPTSSSKIKFPILQAAAKSKSMFK
jgi:hypothetical protein